MAEALARGGNDVEIWALEQDVTDWINNEHENKRYLPDFKLHENLHETTDLRQAASNKEFIIFASPSLYLAKTISQVVDVPGIIDGTACIGVLTKGFV